MAKELKKEKEVLKEAVKPEIVVDGEFPSWYPEHTVCPKTGIHLSQWLQEKAKRENAERVENEKKAAEKK